jgi:hypothetical protein
LPGLQLAAVLPDVAYPSYLIGSRKYARQITSSPFEVVDSHLANRHRAGSRR